MDAHFYAVAYEKGFDDEPLPIWTDRPRTVDPFDLSGHKVVRLNIPEVPGAFQLLNVLSTEEADNLVRLAEELGFGEDSPVSLPHSIRHNKNVNWVVSERIDGFGSDRSLWLLRRFVEKRQRVSMRAFASIAMTQGTSSSLTRMGHGWEAEL